MSLAFAIADEGFQAGEALYLFLNFTLKNAA
jgi:hypothetical protein